MAEFVLPINKEEFDKAGSKFITMGEKETETYREVEMGMPTWKTTGKSIAFPVIIVKGIDEGREQEIVAGVDSRGVWKLKDILRALGVEFTFTSNGSPKFSPQEVFGKRAKGKWIKETGRKGGLEDGELVTYPKLVDILPLDANTENALL